MQVEGRRRPGCRTGVRVRSAWEPIPPKGSNLPRGKPKRKRKRPSQAKSAAGGACVGLGRWVREGRPKPKILRRFVRAIGHTGTEKGPDSTARQQWGILDTGRKPDPATFRGRGRPPWSKLPSPQEERDAPGGGSPGSLRASSRGKTEGASVVRKDWAYRARRRKGTGSRGSGHSPRPFGPRALLGGVGRGLECPVER
eukprot:scaffold3862_cov2921-Pavlova_lutheri.AAC.5